MKPTPHHLSQLLRSLVEIGRDGGHLQDRWSLRDLIVSAGLPPAQAEEGIAEAFPYPSTPEEAFTAGILLGSNFGVEGPASQDFDDEGMLRPVQWRMKVMQNQRWIQRFVSPLRIEVPVPEHDSGMPLWLDVNLDGVLLYSLRLLGVGGFQIHWERIPKKYWTQVFAGFLDSTSIAMAGDFTKDHEGFNRQVHDQELVLDAGEFALASAICGGIEGARLCTTHHTADRLLEDEQGPFGVLLSGNAIPWFFNEVMNWLHYSVMRAEKNQAFRFDAPNKYKENTGVRLTKDQTKELRRWAEALHRKRVEVTTTLMCHFAKSPKGIGRSISMVTAWNILKEFDWWLEQNQRKLRKSRK